MKPVVAAVFAGQGAEEPGVGAAWSDDPCLAAASAACGLDVPRVLAQFGPELARTSILQPVLVALGLAAWARVTARVAVDLVAGHSVGELGAWAATGAIEAAEAIGLARARGVAMEREASAHPGGMIALGAGVAIEDVLACGRAVGVLDLAARNGPAQRVYAGELAAVAAVERRFGGRRLRVSGPWHSALVAPAAAELSRALAELAPRTPLRRPRLVTGLDGRVLAEGERPELAQQVGAPVAWDRVLETFVREGVTDVIALAPGRTQRGLLREGLGPKVRLRLADTDADIAMLARAVHEESHP